MLTDDEILNAMNDVPLVNGPQSFVLGIGRTIEAKVLEKHGQVLLELLRLYQLPGGMTENLEQWQAAWDRALAGPHGVQELHGGQKE